MLRYLNYLSNFQKPGVHDGMWSRQRLVYDKQKKLLAAVFEELQGLSKGQMCLKFETIKNYLLLAGAATQGITRFYPAG